MTINIVDKDIPEYAEYGQLVIEVPVPQLDTASVTGIEKLGSVFCGYTECLYRVDNRTLYKLLKAWSEVDQYRDCVFVFSAKEFQADEFDTSKCMEVSICKNGECLEQIVIAEKNGLGYCICGPLY